MLTAEQYDLGLFLGQEHDQEREIEHLEGSILGLDGSGAIVRCIGSSSLRVNHKQGTQLGLVPLLLSSHLLLLFCSSSPLSLLAAIGHGRALPSASAP